MIKNPSYVIFIMTICLVFFYGDVANAGFGVSPGQINEDNLIPGSNFENTIYLVQVKQDIDLKVGVTVESSEIKDWFTFVDGDEFVIPAGVQQFPFKVKINVPEDAELGEYKAYVRINTVPPEGDRDGQVSISIGGRVDYTIVVGDNVIKEYNITSIDILDIKENENPQAEFKIKNTGNVSAAPVAASFELFNKFGTVRLGFSEVSDFKKVPSFSEEKQIIEFPIDIKFAPGEYWGDIKVYDDEGKTISTLKTIFNVSEATFFENISGTLKWIAGGLVSIIVLLIFLWIIKKRLRKNRLTKNKVLG